MQPTGGRDSLPDPVRVLVKGSSLVLMNPDRPSARGAYPFPRWIQVALHEHGQPAECRNAGVVGERTHSAFRSFEQDLMAWSPDVVVFGYAYYECIHLFLPHWLERHVNTVAKRPGPWRRAYRRVVLRPVWKALAHAQQFADGRIGARLFGRKLARVVRDYRELVVRSRGVGSPLVLVLDLLGPTGPAAGWFPGMAARIDLMNEALEDMVAGLGDPDVRILSVRRLAESLPPGLDPVPDGFHYRPELRRMIGEAIADEVLRWHGRSLAAVPDPVEGWSTDSLLP
jgi:hypothetical protein